MSPEYLAGFFDGEGCISITVHGKNRQVQLRCTIVNTDYALLREIESCFGGNVYQRSRGAKANWKPFCCIVWLGHQAAILLATIQPHLILKAPQAALAGEFWSFMQLPRKERCIVLPTRGNGNIYVRSPETLGRELDYKASMHALNRKGISNA